MGPLNVLVTAGPRFWWLAVGEEERQDPGCLLGSQQQQLCQPLIGSSDTDRGRSQKWSSFNATEKDMVGLCLCLWVACVVQKNHKFYQTYSGCQIENLKIARLGTRLLVGGFRYYIVSLLHGLGALLKQPLVAFMIYLL